MNKNANRQVKEIQEIALNKNNIKISLIDIAMYLECRKNEDFKPMQQTKLFINHGGKYCRLAEIVNSYFDIDNH